MKTSIVDKSLSTFTDSFGFVRERCNFLTTDSLLVSPCSLNKFDFNVSKYHVIHLSRKVSYVSYSYSPNDDLSTSYDSIVRDSTVPSTNMLYTV